MDVQAESLTRQPASVKPPPTPSLTSLVSIVTGVTTVAGLYLAREVLVPITLAILLSFVLAALVELLRRIWLPRALSVLAAVLLGLAVLGTVGGVIGIQVAQLASDVPQYASTVETKVSTLQAMTLGRISTLANRLGRQMQHEPQVPAATSSSDAAVSGQQQPIPVTVQQPSADPLVIAKSVLAPILSPLESTLIIFIVAVFILMQKEDLRDRMIRLFGSGDLQRTTVAMDETARRLSRYFLSQLAINTIFGVVIGIGLALIGVPSPVLWGILAAILRFVPYVGPLIGAALPAALAAAISPHWSLVAWTLGLFAVTEGVTGQVVEPLVYGHSTGLSPLAVVVAAIFWSWIWGPIGLVLSTPLTLCLVVLGRYIERLEFLDILLGDRPALTPVENFYQRMLADDPDEALEQAELLLKDRSLTTYYDEVALKGLQLAANDAQRGVLEDAKLEQIKRNVRSLIDDLDHHDDGDPPQSDKAEADPIASTAEKSVARTEAPAASAPPTEQREEQRRGKTPVLCLAGKGPLDEATSSILAQLLAKHGLGSRVSPYQAASREGVADLNVQGVAMICISYLEISGNPAALHYLMRRLRQRKPGVPILVGLWPSEDAAFKDKRIQAVIGADYYTTSLRETIETCIMVANPNAEQSERDVA
jgi:predicted PurR-regulated permease PerM